MNFALERTDSALSLLALEKASQHYCIHHFDKRPLPAIAQKQASLLQEMLSLAPTTITELTVGIDDKDLLIKQIHLHSAKNDLDAYQQCENILAKEITLKHYSWDAEILKKNDNEYQLFCAAYPLEKIIFLQELFTSTKVVMRELLPSVYAAPRATNILNHIECKNPYWLKVENDQLRPLVGLAIRDLI